MSKANQKPRRRPIPEPERRRVWVRAGGRCVLCNRDLMEGTLVPKEMQLGEAAHVVGQQNNAVSPRGLSQMPAADRDRASNLLLACGSCHDEIDNKVATGILDVGKLHALKQEHEDRIRHLTGMVLDQRTVVLRVSGRVRGHEVDVHTDTTTDAVLKSGNRYPDYTLSYNRRGVEIDIRHLPGENDASSDYYNAAKRVIDEVIDQKLSPGVVTGHISHLSVFAFARLPILIYLGSKLDDTFPTDVYQRHRQSDSWEWQNGGDIVDFDCRLISGALATDSQELVLIANVSGTITSNELPAELLGHPIYQLTPSGGVPGPDTLQRRESLAGFVASVRTFFSFLESTSKGIRRIHFFGALPLSAAVSLGRAHDPHVHPRLLIYDRNATGYLPTLELL